MSIRSGSGSAAMGGVPRSTAAPYFTDAEELKRSSAAALVLEVPTERIVAATPSASLVLDPQGGTVVGRNFEDFTTDGPTGALHLFAGGHVTGYEAIRQFRRSNQESLPVSVWLHRFDSESSSRFAQAVLLVPVPATDPPALPEGAEPAVVGTTDQAMHIERITNDTVELFGLSHTVLLGRPLTDVVVEDDRTVLRAAVTAAATDNRPGSVYVHIAPAPSEQTPRSEHAYLLVVLPMHPPPSCAFMFLRERVAPGSVRLDQPGSSDPPPRLSTDSPIAGLPRRLSGLKGADLTGLAALTTREWEIVARLIDGDRVPVIAAELFVSQSTVRSHLAVVFRKLHVSSQQELMDRILGKRSAGD